MYRQLLAAVLMLAFTVQTFNQGLIVFGFYANQDAIARKLCVNKAKPKMLCHGKCQLMKKLQEEEKKDKENSERKIDNKAEIVFINDASTNINYNLEPGMCNSFPLHKDPLLNFYLIDIFHPPQL